MTTITGKMSFFGGPEDRGVRPDEELALAGNGDVENPLFAGLFLSRQPDGTTGCARRLNPNACYVAARWDYSRHPEHFLRHTLVRITNPRNGAALYARPIDWGPNEDTGRVMDLSPGAAASLGLATDDTATLTIYDCLP